ncbi:MAG: protein-L-isoaspartate O-methyltransferase [Betaproteobacteria bacterium]|nr:protein-L-isoaspartate O-methyltransferase [Betaproteobacteria bacterium]
MNFEQARYNMIEQQIRPWEVLNEDVLDLLFVVKREEFVPAAYRSLAFADVEIPLGHDACMLAPKIEAHALQALRVRKSDKVLEIGAGSGYMAALLAAHAEHVWSVEIVPQLAEQARATLRRMDIGNVTVETGDAASGWPAHMPYDVIMVSGSLPVLPPQLTAQLKIGGRLFAVIGEAPAMQARLITRMTESSYQDIALFETVTTALINAPQPARFIF